jgi:uncharacterized protein involved in outer membrane biogenesis
MKGCWPPAAEAFMVKKVTAAVAAVIVIAVIGAIVWAQSILATDTVRTAIAGQVSKAIGQPVAIGGISASIFPRVTINLDQVAIGEPARIQVATIHVATNFGALLSRRIEHGALRLSGAKIELPLPSFGGGSPEGASASDGASGDGAPVEIVSIDEIVLNDVEIVSGGRTLRGDIAASIEGESVILRSVELTADDTSISATGRLANLSAPTGELKIKAGSLNVDRLLAFAGDFAGGSGGSTAKPSARAGTSAAPALNVTVSLDADRASMGGLTIDKLTGTAKLNGDAVRLEPLAFGLFGGRYEGTIAANFGARTPTFRWNATLTGVDVAAATAFAGSPDVVSGRMSGKIDLTGSGADLATAMKTARGTARIDVVDGIVKKLGLVRSVVIATSMREGATQQAMVGGSTDEPFTRLGGTFRIADASASTDDLRFESKDLLLDAAGNVRADTTVVNLKGKVQLSDELSKQAGSDLTRYTQDQGRVTLPATITGPANNLSVRIDVADMAKRAITNRATEEAQKRLKGLGGLIRRP